LTVTLSAATIIIAWARLWRSASQDFTKQSGLFGELLTVVLCRLVGMYQAGAVLLLCKLPGLLIIIFRCLRVNIIMDPMPVHFWQKSPNLVQMIFYRYWSNPDNIGHTPCG
jgi:hypothetical protein